MAANIGLDTHKRNSWTRHRAVLTVFLMALTGPLGCAGRSAHAAATDGWMEYVYADDGFAIRGPSQAVAVNEQGEDSPTHAYAIFEGVGVSFTVKVTLNDASRDENERSLKIVAERNPRVVKAIKQAGMNGVKVGFDDKDGATHGRILAGEGRIFTIFAQGPAKDYPAAVLEHWLDTFRLVAKGK